MGKILAIGILLLLAGCDINYENLKKEKVATTGNLVTSWIPNEQTNQKEDVKEKTKIPSTNQENLVKKYDKVVVDYIGFFPDGKVFDTSIKEIAQKEWIYNAIRDYKPLEFVVGMWQMIPCFEKWVEWMKVWETKEITCQPKDTYGECDKNKIKSFPKSQFKELEKAGYKLEKWAKIPTPYWIGKIIDTTNNSIKVDFNHPMCWKILKFKIILREIKK